MRRKNYCLGGILNGNPQESLELRKDEFDAISTSSGRKKMIISLSKVTPILREHGKSVSL